MKEAGVYVIVNKLNGKRYVGSSIDWRCRLGGHRRALDAGRHNNRHLQAAWKKYGADVFVFAIMERVERKLMLEREQFYMDVLRPEYNIGKVAAAPMLGVRLSEEQRAKKRGRLVSEATRAKLSAGKTGKKRAPFTAEHRARMSAAATGRNRSAESVEKSAAAHRGRKLTGARLEAARTANLGRKMSDEQKEKIRAAMRRVWREASEETKASRLTNFHESTRGAAQSQRMRDIWRARRKAAG
jgi:group I intron endonuclease